MCGIAGFAGGASGPQDRVVLQDMCDALQHRGPDDQGMTLNDGFGLGMRRLSIIDLADGRQPMATADGSHVLVYNGETYNYRALRQELEQSGARFHTCSDTEVVLQAFAVHGTAGFRHLNGMFALAVLDTRRRRLVLCRDPIGIKPLYYYDKPGAPFVFASELKALLRHPAVGRTLNQAAIWDYLTYEYVPGPQTMFAHVHRLEPGHYLTWENGSVTTTPYWDYPLTQDHTLPLASSPGRFADLFETVVADQLVADVPVGVFLSGGLDSTAVTAAAASCCRRPVKTFCIGFKEPTLTDETAYARETAEALGTEHHEAFVDGREYLEAVPGFVEAMDEPNADMAAIGKWFASRLAAGHVKVVLSGEGGDEMLGGYRLNEAMARFDQLRLVQRLPRALFRDLPAGLLDRVGCAASATRLRQAFLPLEERCAHTLPSMTRRYSECEKRRLFRAVPEPCRDSQSLLRELFVRARTLQPLTQIQYAWSKQWLAEHLLMQADRMSMRESLELRVPMLDIRLAEFLFRLPDAHKIRKVEGVYRTKYLLRRYLEGRVPPAVLARPKRGFQIPNVRFVRHDLRADIGRALDSPASRVAAFLRPDEIRHRLRLVDERGDELTCQKVWSLYILEMWCRRWG